MTTIRIAFNCFAAAMIFLNKPLGRMTASWQRLIGLGTAADETANRVLYVIGGAILLILAIWVS